ncbi:MAG TPA: outer membrane beta-barrel protein [Gammaproteobacteria bacterium]
MLAWALTPAVEAQPESAYYGLSIGKFDYSDRAAGLAAFDGSADSWRATIGYQFLKHFAFEGTYGETSTVRETVSGSPPGSTELGFETELSKILGFRALATFPFDSGLSLLAGGGFVNFEQHIAVSRNGAPYFGADIDRPAQLTYYFGVQYDWDRVALRLSYEKWDFGSDALLSFVDADAQELALGFFYKL